MKSSVKQSLALSMLPLAFLPSTEAQPTARTPRGVYAVISVKDLVNQQETANPAITQAQLDAYFDTFYGQILAEPAVSGLALQLHWDLLNPNPPTGANPYFWNYVDDAFSQVLAWNNQNPSSAAKTIQLLVNPGFQTPQWVMNQIPSCDGLFMNPAQTPSTACGSVTFSGYGEGGDSTELPLPWNPVYKSAWQTFLTALAARYGANPLFVSLQLGGPTAASTEMLLPNDLTAANPQTQFGVNISPNDMWRQLIAFHYPGMAAYLNSDQAFIDEWNATIDIYGRIFNGVTLVINPAANALPSFNKNPVTIPAGFSGQCGNPEMECAAQATILSHFADPTVGGANAKAVQTSGMKGWRTPDDTTNFGISGVKLLAQNTALLTTASAQILGGAQFDTSVAVNPLGEGCTVPFPPIASDTPAGCTIPASCTANGCIPVECIPQACLAPGVTPSSLTGYGTYNKVPANDLIPPEQAAYNVLNIYFDGTPVASTFGGTIGTAPLNYLQIYSPDIQYAEANVNLPAQVVESGGMVANWTAQSLLVLASQKLLSIAEPPLLPAIRSGGIVPGTIQPGEWVSIFGTNLASFTANWNGDFPVLLGGASVTINGKAAYLSYASPGQINLQSPNDSAVGAVPVVVSTATGTAKSTVTLAALGPSFFLLDGKHVAGIILRSNGKGAYGGGSYDILGPTGTSLGYATVAAKAGDTVELFGNGFGPTSPTVQPGQPFSGAAATTNPVMLRINSVNVTPEFAGLAGAGLYQLNLSVPSGLGTGDVSLQAIIAGVQTPVGAVISLQ